MHDLHHQLLWLDGVDHVLTEGLCLYGIGECLGDLIVYVGVEQCAAHILKGLGDIYFGDFAFTF